MQKNRWESLFILGVICAVVTMSGRVSAQDWQQFRGPNARHQGHQQNHGHEAQGHLGRTQGKFPVGRDDEIRIGGSGG